MSDKNKFKRFATGSATTDSIAASLKPAEGDDSGYESIPLIRIHPDPENPRHLDLDAANPRQVAEDDPRREEKLAEIEDLENLALSIASQGVLTPIRVYRVGRDFRIAHGERRYLASVMAGCGSILSIVLKERPDNLRLQQLIENFQRKGLSLFRRCENIRSVVKESEQLGNGHVDVDKLRELTGIGRTQAFQYMAILAAPKDVWEAVRSRRAGWCHCPKSPSRVPRSRSLQWDDQRWSSWERRLERTSLAESSKPLAAWGAMTSTGPILVRSQRSSSN